MKFKERERVRLSQEGIEKRICQIENSLYAPSTTGIVISCKDKIVYVLRDRRKVIEGYSIYFWESNEELFCNGEGI
ncbi:MAG: hypothetical protein ABFD75_12205 [Smithella sp.]